MSRDIPIIMSAPMIRALLREIEAPGTGKTMTRRIAWRDAGFGLQDHSSEQLEEMDAKGWDVVGEGNEGMWRVYKPSPWQRVKPGDRLWVRETLVPGSCGFDYDTPDDDGIDLSDMTDAQVEFWNRRAGGDPDDSPRVSPIHMPRWASRLTLIVTATKIERLQNISEADAVAEGAAPDPDAVAKFGYPQVYKFAFADLWEGLHGPGSWDDNPECVALSFKPHLCNIDAMPEAQAA